VKSKRVKGAGIMVPTSGLAVMGCNLQYCRSILPRTNKQNKELEKLLILSRKYYNEKNYIGQLAKVDNYSS
jgi:hypothetical protein